MMKITKQNFGEAIFDILAVIGYPNERKNQFLDNAIGIACGDAYLELLNNFPNDLNNMNCIFDEKKPETLLLCSFPDNLQQEAQKIFEKSYNKTLLSLTSRILPSSSQMQRIKLELILERFANLKKEE